MCRHQKMWIIAGGYWYWCYECGAVREAQPTKTGNASSPIGKWIKPVGKRGDNPYEMLTNRGSYENHHQRD